MSEKGSEASSTSVARRPIYYSGSSRPIYYGSKSGGMAYGGAPYGGTAAYYGGHGGTGGPADDDSLVGAVTLGRILRVCSQRWVTIVVFTIIGLILAFAVYKVSPTIFEATSVFEMSIRKPSIMGGRGAIIDVELNTSMDEVFNTRLASLRSRAIFEQIATMYRSEHPSSTVTDEVLYSTLGGSKMTLQRRSRLINITVRSQIPELAADLANAYAKAAELFMSDRNKGESDAAVSWLTSQTEQAKRLLERTDKEMLDYRTANQVEFMESERQTAQSSVSRVNADVLELESQVTKASELKKTLEAIQTDPDKFGSLPDSVPRSSEISESYQRVQQAIAEKNALLARFTANHPDVKVKEREFEIYSKQFADVVYRALETCKANLDLLQRQLSLLTPKVTELTKKISDLELKIVAAKMRLEQLAREREVADSSYQALLKRAQEAQYAADENTAIIKQVEKALKPTNSVLPNPMVIFPAGFASGLFLGLLFVLMLDRLEDKIVGIGDIEQRLRLKPLVVLPHVRRKSREQIAQLVVMDKFSLFAEGIASLRNLLDSPRYHDVSKMLLIISTQPGEGKTISSCSLAQSCALSGQKTLLVDFDMRRPRIARIFSKSHKDFVSLPHTLVKGDSTLFDTLPVSSGIENMDIICSKASSEISPAALMGSGAIVAFFEWAREHYDRIIVDSPPFGIVGDVMTLASLVDGVMIMCCPDRTRFQSIKHAARHLTEAGARVLGVVVNDVDFGRQHHFAQFSYGYHSSYKYGKQYSGYAYGYGGKRSTKPAQAVGSKNAQSITDDDEASAGIESEVEQQESKKQKMDAVFIDDE